jgi:aromatase
MHTENRIFVKAPVRRVYEFAASIEDWPRLLPHYRYVHVIDPAVGGDRRSRLVKMGATRSGIPVSWTSLQHLEPRQRKVRYRHVGGVTRGMDVLWTLQPVQGGTQVIIEHDLLSSRWWLRPRPFIYIVGTLFVEFIADRTLAGVKRAAEARR